jgi:hypothetical protein
MNASMHASVCDASHGSTASMNATSHSFPQALHLTVHLCPALTNAIKSHLDTCPRHSPTTSMLLLWTRHLYEDVNIRNIAF